MGAGEGYYIPPPTASAGGFPIGRFTLIVLLSALLLAAPSALASHWTLHDSAVDDDVRRTREDDAQVMDSGPASLVGRANRVVYPGSTPGDGGLFLDARLGNLVGTDGARFVDLYAGAFANEALGTQTVLLPGMTSQSAWYGHWADLNANGLIDDVHDAAADATDEFVWHGQGDGATVAMTTYTTPYPDSVSYTRGEPSRAYESTMIDRTARANPSQEWIAAAAMKSADGGFIKTIQTFTVAGARALVGGGIDFDLDDPAALYDVDTYAAVSGDVETLWTSSVRDADAARLAVLAAFWAVVDPINEEAQGAIPAIPSTQSVTRLAFDTLGSMDPWDPKEPNTEWDDFDGRALYGGASDVYGSHNTYDGYFDGFHFFHDTRARLAPCFGTYARVPGPETEIRAAPATCVETGSDPVASLVIGARSAGVLLTFKDEVTLWRDINQDGEIGRVCDPNDPNEFDAERNTCAPEFHGRKKSFGSGSEVAMVCPFTDAPSGIIRVSPMGADWPPGTFLVRDSRDTTRVAFDLGTELLVGDAEVIVRWNEACSSNAKNIDSRDGIWFALGESTVPLRVESRMSLASFRDVDRGIDNGYEYVLDVDVLAAIL